MDKVACNMMPSSSSSHLSQIFTGFSLLNKSGEISLTQECLDKKPIDLTSEVHLQYAKNVHLLVILNNKIKLYYDMHDSYEINTEVAERVDYYFKRSYEPNEVPNHLASKVFPLGLNYFVTTNYFDIFEIRRILAFQGDWAHKVKGVVKLLAGASKIVPTNFLMRSTHENIYSSPDCLQGSRVLFMVRSWDPEEFPGHSAEQIDGIIHINETRARCVKLLRKEFGKAFTGGFQHTGYAKNKFKDVLLENGDLSAKDSYIKLLQQHPICVATTGLHKSIGGKLGEYVAFSKSIVSEKLNYSVPGEFKKRSNYLEFETPEQCVEQCVKLFSDTELRCNMMKKNNIYYHEYLRPDVLVKRTLEIALK